MELKTVYKASRAKLRDNCYGTIGCCFNNIELYFLKNDNECFSTLPFLKGNKDSVLLLFNKTK